MMMRYLLLFYSILLLLLTWHQVECARSRRQLGAPQLDQVALLPLRLTSLHYSSASSRRDQFILMRLFFDRTIQRHTIDNIDEAIQNINITCDSSSTSSPSPSSYLSLIRWSDDPQQQQQLNVDPSIDTNQLSLVLPLTSTWMQYFDSYESSDADDGGGASTMMLPRNNIYDSRIPFASNEFTLLFASPSSSSKMSDTRSLHQRLRSCHISIDSMVLNDERNGRSDSRSSDTSQAIITASLQSHRRSRKSSTASNHDSSLSLSDRSSRQPTVHWYDMIRTTRWIMPSPPVATTPSPSSSPSSSSSSSSSSCADSLSSQRLVFLESSASSVSSMASPVIAVMMSPLSKQFEQTSTTQVAEQIAKNYVSTLTGSIPPEVSNTVAENVAKGVNELVMDLVTTSITDSCSSSIAGTLGSYLTRSVSEDIGMIIRDHLIHSVSQLISPIISRSVATEVTKELPSQIVNDVTMSLTHTLVGALTRSLSGFNQMQSVCRECALYQHRCSDCEYVKDVARSTSYYSAQYSHYYAGYYSQYYAKVADKMQRVKNDQGIGEEETKLIFEEDDPPAAATKSKSKGKSKKK